MVIIPMDSITMSATREPERPKYVGMFPARFAVTGTMLGLRDPPTNQLAPNGTMHCPSQRHHTVLSTHTSHTRQIPGAPKHEH